MQALPKKIGKYQVIADLGRGYTGIVYQAHDAFAKRDVAIKVFTENRYAHDIEHANFDQLFTIATAISSKINHPHIVSTFDAHRDNGLNYVVMELVQGHSLQNHVDMGMLLPMHQVIQASFKCCLALNFANSEGIIHQDIKPSNIMLTIDNDVKIIDFGTAVMTHLDDMQDLHLLAYAAPERLVGKPLTFQSDIYSLGATMFKLLTGKLPFAAEDSFSYSDKVLHDEPVNIRTLRPEVSEALANVVHKALQKSPAKRYAAWIDMATDLAGCEMLVESETRLIADSDKFNDLKKLAFFVGFSDIELWEVIRISEWAKFLTGRTLVKEGDFGASFFVLIKGRVSVSISSKIIATLDKGDCFGEMAYIDKANAERSASVVSMMPVMLMKIKSAVLEQASQSLQVRFNRAFLKLLVQRLAQANLALASKIKS